MVKSNKCKSFKRYLFAGSLILLFLVTLAMTTNVFAVCQDSRDFNCTVTETCSGEIVSTYEECFNLCIFDDSASLSSGCFNFNLKFLNSKNLLGIDANYPVGGCSVNFKGRSMIIDYMPLNVSTGCRFHFQCKPCDGCCPG